MTPIRYDERQELAAPMFWKAVMRVRDLRPGARLRGVVRNPTEFGAFVDLGELRSTLQNMGVWGKQGMLSANRRKAVKCHLMMKAVPKYFRVCLLVWFGTHISVCVG